MEQMGQQENGSKEQMNQESSSCQAKRGTTNPIRKMRDSVWNIIGKKSGNGQEVSGRSSEPKRQATGTYGSYTREQKPSQDTSYSPDPDADIKTRVTELEEHVIKFHKEFNKFVIDSDQFLNRESFMELKNEFNEKMKALDRLEKSIDESKKEILKDTSYMDDIVQGFTYVKNKIDTLEKRMNQIQGGNATIPVGAGNGTDAARINALEAQIAELKDEIRALKTEKGVPVARKVAEVPKKCTEDKSTHSSEISGNIDKLKVLCGDI